MKTATLLQALDNAREEYQVAQAELGKSVLHRRPKDETSLWLTETQLAHQRLKALEQLFIVHTQP